MRSEQLHAGDMMWNAVSEQARIDWSMAQAAQDPAVQGVMYIFMRHDFHDEAVKDTMKDALEEFVLQCYEVPRECSEEVFERAQILIKQRTEKDGEA